MITLNLDNPVLDGAAGAAAFFQLLGQGLKAGGIKGQPADDRHPFALSSFGFTADSNASLSGSCCLLLPTDAGSYRLVALGTDPSMVGRIDGGLHGFHSWHFPLDLPAPAVWRYTLIGNP